MSEQLRNLIVESGYSQYAIYTACGIDKGAMSRFMSGKVGLGMATLDRISVFLGVELTASYPNKKGG